MAVGNQARLKTAELLATLAESGLFQFLGHSSVAQYAEREFQICRSETLEMLRVAREIERFPELQAAFEASRVSWSSLKEITRVASEETEGKWLAFAAEHTVAELRAETQDARRKKRDRPRDDRFGLPDLITKVVLELTREERARLDAALERVARELAGRLRAGHPGEEHPGDGRPGAGHPGEGRLGEEPLSPKDLFLYMAERVLADGRIGGGDTGGGETGGGDTGGGDTGGGDTGGGDTGGGDTGGRDTGGRETGRCKAGGGDGRSSGRSAFAVIYHQCETCRRAQILTDDGAFAVDPECVERRKGSVVEERIGVSTEVRVETELADRGTIDRPNSAALARRVKLRDGDRCANPGCRKRERLHAHHIHFRADGGRTVIENEVSVCDTCHALIHAGLLAVSGTPWDGLTWVPRSSGLRVDTRSSARALAEVPAVTVESVYADGARGGTRSGRPVNGDATSKRGTAENVHAERGASEGIVSESITDENITAEVAELLDDLAGALTSLGMTRQQAMRRLEHAHRELSARGRAFDEAEILSRALSG